jgi:class 3 adenylate cyclase/tetratricopeptide (TPR) repeat protein
MDCPNCQLVISENVNFCYECGHRIHNTSEATTQVLSNDEKLEKIQKYLPEGLAETILSQKDKIEGERKQVTVMFCDMVGYTSLVDMIGLEEAYGIMDQVYEILIPNVHNFEGTVNEMTGDGIIALFGAPIALEDAPQKALWSALSIHHEIARFSDQKKGIGPIKMRIGIHTGPVIVGTLGNDLHVEFKAVGDTVNLAHRIEGLAEPGTTYVTEETFKLTTGLFRFQTIGKKAVKGKKQSVPLYKVLSRKADVYRPRLGSERRIYSELVGRGKELEKLELQVEMVVNGKGSIVNVIGEAGIGKSRLIAEMKKHKAMRRVALFEGRAISIGENLSFHPIIDIFKQWARIRKDDGEAMALGKLEVAVSRLFPVKYGEVLPFVATLMGMKLSGRYAERLKGIEGEALENLILKNVRELIIRASEQTPLVIVMEDLQWSDTSSIDLLVSLLRLAGTQRILFINVFRPGHKDIIDRMAKTLKEEKEKKTVNYVEIVLEPLDGRMSESLITNMLNISEFQHDIIKLILKRAGGNPFFIEEVVRSFIDEGSVILKNGSFQVTEKIHTIAIPRTINDVLMSRIDRLDEPCRDLVKVASVVGRNFFYRILKEATGMSEDLDDRISYLKEIQIIRERRRMGELEYLFKHALAQEAAYESILPQRQKALHLKVAASIEKVFGERLNEFYGMLAYHYSKAESLEKTEEYLIKAGEEALKSSASSEALHYYQEALDLYLKNYGDASDSKKIALLEKNIALALYNKGQHVEAVEYFDKALNYYWGDLPKHPISVIFRFLSGFFHLLVSLYLPFLKFKKIPSHRDNESIDLFFKKLKTLAIINPKKYFVESVYFYRRLTKFDLTKFELGIGMFAGASNLFSFTGISFGLSKKILDILEGRVDKNDIKSFIIYDFSETLHKYMAGNWKTIKEYDDDLVNKNLSVGEIYWTSQHFFWHGCPKVYQGYLGVSKLLVNKLNDLFEEYENDLSMLLKYLLNTSLLLESHNLHEALDKIKDGIEFGQKISQGSILIEMYSRKAHILILTGDIELAENSLALADKVRREIDTVPWQLTDFFRSQFELDLYRLNESIRSGNKREASQCRKKANKSGKRLLKVTKKVAQYRTDSYKLRGVYCWLINEQKKALKWWQRAIAEGESLNARLELSRSYFEVGKRLLEDKSKFRKMNGIKAHEYLEKARALFEEMELHWDLDELDRVLKS